MEKARITESELVLPSLYLMTLNPQGSISTSELIRLLTQILKPTGIDAEIQNRPAFSNSIINTRDSVLKMADV